MTLCLCVVCCVLFNDVQILVQVNKVSVLFCSVNIFVLSGNENKVI